MNVIIGDDVVSPLLVGKWKLISMLNSVEHGENRITLSNADGSIVILTSFNDIEPYHGRLASYTNDNCRCDLCKQARTEYGKSHRQKKKKEYYDRRTNRLTNKE